MVSQLLGKRSTLVAWHIKSCYGKGGLCIYSFFCIWFCGMYR